MDNISTLKVQDLKRELKTRGLSITGAKQDLQTRLRQALLTEKPPEDSNMDDALLEEDDDILDDDSDVSGSGDSSNAISPTTPPATEEAFLNTTDLLKSPEKKSESLILKSSPSAAISSPVKTVVPISNTQNGNNSEEPSMKKQKITINRTPVQPPAPKPESTTISTLPATAATNKEKVAIVVSNDEEENKPVVKLTAAQVTDKLALRQQKFGSQAQAEQQQAKPTTDNEPPTNANDKLKSRAERFNVITSLSATTNPTGKISLTTVDETKIAQRKQRFGEISVDDLKQKRGARFAGSTTVTKKEIDEKKKSRAERFNIN